MAEPGAVGWQFERIAYFSFPSSALNFDKAFELGIEAGANDVVEEDGQPKAESLRAETTMLPVQVGISVVPS